MKRPCLYFSIQLVLLLLFSFVATSQVSVTATAGTAGPTAYVTLKGAFDAINSGTHQGNISISITASTAEVAQAVLNASGSGAALYTAVTIKPATGATPTISGAVTAALIKLNGASNVTIDGSNTAGGTTRNLTITNTSATSPSVLLIGSVGTTPITNVTIKNTIMINGANTASALITSDAASAGVAGYFSNITIQNNSVQKAYIGMYVIHVAGAAISNVLITGNDLNTSGANAIRLVGIYGQGVNTMTVSNNNLGNFSSTEAEFDRSIWLATAVKNATISGNNISNMAYTGTSVYAPIGINVSSGIANANINVNNNTVSNMTSSGTGTTMGMFLYGAMSDVTVSGNKISNIKNTNTGGWGAAGMALSPTLAASAFKIHNNFVWDVAAFGFDGYGSADNGNGIVLDGAGSGGFDIYHNTIVLNSEQTITGSHRASCLLITANVTTTGTINLRDNILSNQQTTGNANSRLALSVAAPTGGSVFGTINNNNYYSISTNLSSNQGTLSTTLAQLQGSIGQNANSFNVLPLFVAAGDLHMSPANTTLSNSGVPVGTVTTDIDGDARSGTTPDIGADEFVPCPVVTIGTPPANTAICPNSNTSFTVVSPNGTLYQWQVNTGSGFADIANGGVYGGATTATLTLTGVPLTYSGYLYRCVVNSLIVCNPTNSAAATLTVNPFPVGVITPASSTALCPAGSVTLNANAGFTYQWQKNGVDITPPATNASYTANTAGSYTVVITNTATTCKDTSDPVTVIINPTISATKTITICTSQLPYTWNSQIITAGGTGVAMYTTPSLVTGCDSTTTLNLVVNSTVAVTKNLAICANQLPYNWNGIIVPAAGTGVATFTTPSVTGCDSTTTLNLSVNPLITATKSLTICQNQLPYTWNGIIVNAGGSGVAVYHTPSLVTGCDSATTLDLTVNPSPATVATPSPVSICSGSATAITLSTTTTGSTFSWTVVQTGVSGATANSGTSIAQTLTATGSTAGTAVYIITATANGCSGTPFRDTVTVKPSPTVVATPSSQTICSGTASSVALSSPVSGTTFAWTAAQTNATGAAAGNGASISQTLTATTAAAGTATYTVTPSANGCTGATSNVTVTVSPVPAVPGTITGVDAPCVGSTQTYSITAVTGATSYIWTIPNGWTGSSTSNSITVTVGSNSGTVTVKSSNSCGSSAAATKTVTAIPVVTPTITISSNATTPQCSGNMVTFTAVATNVGSSPLYQWKVNNNLIGTNSTTFQHSPANGDVVTCTLTSNAPCATVTTLTSNPLTMQITPSVSASLNIYIPENHICSGVQAAFVATPVNGGTDPQYQWKVNNINSGTNSANFSYIPVDNDVVTCEMASNAVCATPLLVLSNAVPMTIVTVTHPAISISSNPASGYTVGQSVTFTANVVQGGAGNQITWYKNGAYILGSGGNTWTGIAGVDFKNKNKIQARLQSLAACAEPDTAWSNIMNITIGTTGIDNQELPDGFSLYPNPAKDLVNIEGLKPGDKATVYDALGNKVSAVTIINDKPSTINVSSFAQGMYFIHFTRQDGEQWRVKLMRQ